MAGKWMQEAFSKHKGAEGRAAKKAGESTQEYAAEHKNSPGRAGKRARLALLGAKISRHHSAASQGHALASGD